MGMLFKLALVLAVAYFASLALRRMYAARSHPGGGRLRVVETVALGPSRSLHLVAVGNRLLLIAATGHEVGLLRDVTDDLGEEAASVLGTGSAPSASFTQRLLEVMQRTGQAPRGPGGAGRDKP
jgi:flagellar biosynthetic protein FliO